MAEGRGWTRRRAWIFAITAVLLTLALGLFAIAYLTDIGDTAEPRATPSPVTVSEGRAFDLGDVHVWQGWRLQSNAGALQIDELTVVNSGERKNYPLLHFTLYEDGQAVAATWCSGWPIEADERITPQCYPGDAVPPHYDEIVVSEDRVVPAPAQSASTSPRS